MCPKIQIDQLLCSKMAGRVKVTAADKNSLHHCLLSQERWLDRETSCSDPTRISNISSYLSVRVQAWYPRNGWHGASCWHLSLSADSRHGVPASIQQPASCLSLKRQQHRWTGRQGITGGWRVMGVIIAVFLSDRSLHRIPAIHVL